MVELCQKISNPNPPRESEPKSHEVWEKKTEILFAQLIKQLKRRRDLSDGPRLAISTRRRDTPLCFPPPVSSDSPESCPFGELSLTEGARLMVHERERKTFL